MNAQSDEHFDEAQVLDGIAATGYHNRDPLIYLHPWWALLPLPVARATVYLGLMQEKAPEGGFLSDLCSESAGPQALETARQQIAEEYHSRLASEDVSEEDVDDIPVVLDLFSGSGRIPFEALRLGGQAYALDVNPVAYVIQLCAIRYPQLFGAADPQQSGSGKGRSWAGLKDEVEYWCNWIHQRAEIDLQDLYPPITLPEDSDGDFDREVTPEYYLWAQAIRCNECKATVPVIRDPWLARRSSCFAALKPDMDSKCYRVVIANSEEQIGFSPAANFKRGAFTCPFCGVTIGRDEVQEQVAQEGAQLLAVVGQDPEGQRVFVDGNQLTETLPDSSALWDRIKHICSSHNLMPPDEPIGDLYDGRMARYGLQRYQDLYTPRQLLTLLIYVRCIHDAYGEMHRKRIPHPQAKAVTTYLGLLLDHLAWQDNRLNRWQSRTCQVHPPIMGTMLGSPFEFVELNPFGTGKRVALHTERIVDAIQYAQALPRPADVFCRSATDLPFESGTFDAIVTDPPYYDAVQYTDLSNFFYVWLRRSVGHLHPEVFTDPLASKDTDISADPDSHGGDRRSAYEEYETRMENALSEAARVLRPERLLTIVLASFKSEPLQLFLEIAGRVGLELFDAKRIPARPRALPSRSEDDGLLLRFRKNRLVQELPEAGVDAEAVLERVAEDRSVLYAGVVQILLEYLEEESVPSPIKSYRAKSHKVVPV